MDVTVTTLRQVIEGTDLEQFSSNATLLEVAIEYAKSMVTQRYNVSSYDDVPSKYDINVLDGAKYYLARIGVEGQISMTENGVSRTYETLPKWLSSIIPKVGVITNVTTTETEG